MPPIRTRPAFLSPTLVRIGIAIGLIGFALFAVLVVLNARMATQLRDTAIEREIHTLQVLIASQNVLSAFKDIETGERGYGLTHDSRYLEPFDAGRAELGSRIDALASLTQDNPRQVAQVGQLRSLGANMLAGADRWVELVERGDRAAAQVELATGAAKATMDSIRATIARIKAEESALLVQRRDAAKAASERSTTAVSLLGVFGLIAFVILAIAARVFLRARDQAVADRAMVAANTSILQSRALLQTIIDESEDVIFVKDLDGCFVFANRGVSRLLGVPLEVIVGGSDRDFLHADIAAAIEAVDHRVMATGEAVSVEEDVPEAGEMRTFLSAKAPWIVGGKVAGVVGISRDITDRKTRERDMQLLNVRLEAMVAERTADLQNTLMSLQRETDQRAAAEVQVRQMQKVESIGQLTGGIAHDFNNMLAIVLGSLRLARRRLTGSEDPKVAGFLDHAEDGANRAAALTARLLAFSRQQPLSPARIDANQLVGSVSEMLRRTLGEGIEIETALAGGLWRAFADVAQVESAVVNLAVNARDAMPGGGKLTIETANAVLDDEYAEANPGADAGQYVLISVSDTGDGMPPDVIERAFEPFFTTKPVGQGTGLGLSQVFGFVKQSNGHLKIYSEAGHGTTVKIYLPRHFGPAVADSGPVVAVRDAPVGRASEVILVVEDEERVRQIASDTLRELGYSVITASRGAEALQLLESVGKVDLLFTDVVMPQMNGRQLAEAALARHAGLRVLYTTGYTRNAIVHNGMLDAGTSFLQKPYTFDQLAKKVRAVLDASA